MGHHEQHGISDEWYTPKYIFDALQVKFDLDVAAPVDKTFTSVPAHSFIHEKSLDMIWPKESFIWMNPPYGGRDGLIPWLDKIADHGNGIALVPDRTSTAWWQNASKQADCFLFVQGKIKFINQYGDIGTKPGNGSTFFGYGAKAKYALLKAQENGLGLVFKRLQNERFI